MNPDLAIVLGLLAAAIAMFAMNKPRMGALRCIDLDSACRVIHWKSLILIVGMLPFSIALQKTGGVDGLHDPGFPAGEYARHGSRQLQVW